MPEEHNNIMMKIMLKIKVKIMFKGRVYEKWEGGIALRRKKFDGDCYYNLISICCVYNCKKDLA